jgi:signal transduction histidine kinase
MTARSWLMRGVRGWPAYAIASALVSCIAVARYALGSVLGDGVPLFPFIMAVLGASLIGGLHVGLYATAVSAVVGELLFVLPYGIFALTDAAEALRCGIFILEGVLVAGVVELLRRARADAIRANDEKDAFIAMLAHEFRNPINAVQTAVGVMKTRQTDERRTWARDMIERQATVMSRLVEDLLDAARIRRQRFDQPQLIPTPLRPILDSTIAAVQPLIQERNLQFDVAFDSDAIVMADPVRLQQAIGNVLTNACRYTQDGGHVSIVVSVGSTVNVMIRDTGIGIAAADMNRLFEPFHRGPQSTGLGLGLFLARTFVQYSGGTLDAISTGEGAGSTFVMRLPVLRQEHRNDDTTAA